MGPKNLTLEFSRNINDLKKISKTNYKKLRIKKKNFK